jgi:ZIP family zinc transporter
VILQKEIWSGLLIPFIGTTAGAACVFFLKKDLKISIQKALTGFAAGVMVAASIWSLIVPAIEQCADKERWAFLPAFIGFWCGILFLLLLDEIIPHLHRGIDQVEGPASKLTRIAMMVLAVTLHNIPEGAIISMPMYAEGKSKTKSFWLGVLSGAVEPLFGALTVIIAGLVVPAMPYFLSFAAGAMLYVVVEELIPEMSAGKHSNIGVVAFAFGFSLMMALDVALG